MSWPYWFELAVIFGGCCIGNIVFEPFAAGVPKWRRVAKMFLGGALSVAVSATAGRTGFYVLLALLGAALVVIHGWWLPKKGINGWTAEPREKYYALRGWKLPPA